MANYGNLANVITGNPAQYGNFASGLGQGMMNIDATQAAIDQAEESGSFSWGDVAEIGGNIVSAWIGAS